MGSTENVLWLSSLVSRKKSSEIKLLFLEKYLTTIKHIRNFLFFHFCFMGMNLFLYDVIVDFYVFFVNAAFYLIYTIEISGDGIFYKFGKNFQISVMSKQNKKNLKKTIGCSNKKQVM